MAQLSSTNVFGTLNVSGTSTVQGNSIVQGNMGIGTASPWTNLCIGTQSDTITSTPTAISLGSSYGNNAMGKNLKLKLYDPNNTTKNYGLGVSAATLEVVFASDGKLVFLKDHATAPVELMRLNADGNVGVGIATIAATNKFHVSQTGTANGSTAIVGEATGSVTGTNYAFYANSSGASINNYSFYGNSGKFYTSGAGGNGGEGIFNSTNSYNSITVSGVDGAGINDISFLKLDGGANGKRWILGVTGTNANVAGDLRLLADTYGSYYERIKFSNVVSDTYRTMYMPLGSDIATGGGIRLEATANGGNQAVFEAIGSRASDTNSAGLFGGQVALAKKGSTAAGVSAGNYVGRVIFGGTHTSNAIGNLLYTASINAYAAAAWSGSTAMATGLLFRVNPAGTAGLAMTSTSDVGVEAMRITSDSNLNVLNTVNFGSSVTSPKVTLSYNSTEVSIDFIIN